MSQARLWPIATIALGLATFAAFFSFNLLPDVANAYPYGAFGAAMSAFQRASTPDDLAAIFGQMPDPGTVAAMNAANTFDLYVFIPLYTLFLIAAGLMLAGDAKKPPAWLVILIAVIAATADVIETAAQLGVTSEWARANVYLSYLAQAAWIKYFALAGQGIICTLICFKDEPRRKILGVLGAVPIVVVVAAASNLVQIPALMISAFGLFWAALIVVAVLELRRPLAPQAPDASP